MEDFISIWEIFTVETYRRIILLISPGDTMAMAAKCRLQIWPCFRIGQWLITMLSNYGLYLEFGQ